MVYPLISRVKTCLLYMSIFPEDFEINCYQLIQLWIAETFVKRREGISVEDVAYGYLRELVNRSLIQVSKVFYEGIPFSCRIHDLLREVIVSKSREQNMVTIATGQHMIRWPFEKVRRLAVHGNSNFLAPNSKIQYRYCSDHLRSLIIFGESMEPQAYELFLSEILSGNKLLKILHFTAAWTLEEIPNKVFNLFHLKYLSLKGTSIRTVPKSIGKLRNLEYLNLSHTKVRELPMEILKLQKLRHLCVFGLINSVNSNGGYYGFKGPSKIGDLLSLHTLFYIDAAATVEEEETSSSRRRIVDEIGKLRELRELGIINLRREDGKELCSSLANLTNLRDINICSSSTKNDNDYYEVIDLNHDHHSPSSTASFLQSLRMLALRCHLEKMPQWITGLKDLVRIQLMWSGLRDEDPLDCLQHLPNLVDIALSHQAYQGEGLCFKAGKFLKLKKLYLAYLQGLRWMRVEEGAMPHLQKLTLEGLPLVKELPFGIQHLAHLQILELGDMSSQLVKKVEEDHNKQSEDYKRIAHIPEVIVAFWTGEKWSERRL